MVGHIKSYTEAQILHVAPHSACICKGHPDYFDSMDVSTCKEKGSKHIFS